MNEATDTLELGVSGIMNNVVTKRRDIKQSSERRLAKYNELRNQCPTAMTVSMTKMKVMDKVTKVLTYCESY